MMMNDHRTKADAPSPPSPPSNAAEASAVSSSSIMDTPHERAYGTFEVSVIEVDSDSEQPIVKTSKSTNYEPRDDASRHHSCGGDCCAAVSFLWMPFRLETYKIVAFHLVNALFAIGAAAWTVLFYMIKLVLSPIASLAHVLRSAEATTLRVLLHADAVLFNFVCPPSERIRVYNVSDGSSYSAQLYFAGGKLLCSAIPGVVAAMTFGWTIRNFVVALISSSDAASSTDDPMAPVEDDVLILLALVAVYASAVLMKVFAVISRHITLFFCAEYLLYAS